MTDASDPTRWSDADSGAPSEIAALLRNAERDFPSPSQLESLGGKLGPQFSASSLDPRRVGLSRKGLPVGRILGVLGLVGLAGVIAVRAGAPSAGAPSAPSNPTPTLPAPAAAPRADSAEPAELSEAASTPNKSAEPAQPRPAHSAPFSKGSPKMGEAELLEQARRALATNPDRALAFTRQHQQRFANGVLRQEREVIAIEALRRLGLAEDAKHRAGTFEKQYPDSAHRRAVETGLGK